jgi:hypothetical protein
MTESTFSFLLSKFFHRLDTAPMAPWRIGFVARMGHQVRPQVESFRSMTFASRPLPLSVLRTEHDLGFPEQGCRTRCWKAKDRRIPPCERGR